MTKNKKIATFISYKKADIAFKNHVSEHLSHKNIIADNTFHEGLWQKNKNEEEIIQEITEKYIRQSTVTILLLTRNSMIIEEEDKRSNKLQWIKRETTASLKKVENPNKGNKKERNGLIVIYGNKGKKILYKQTKQKCAQCGSKTKILKTKYLLSNISKNLFLKRPDNIKEVLCDDCLGKKYEKYIELVFFKDFKQNPRHYLEAAHNRSRNIELTKDVQARVDESQAIKKINKKTNPKQDKQKK